MLLICVYAMKPSCIDYKVIPNIAYLCVRYETSCMDYRVIPNVTYLSLCYETLICGL